MKKLLLAVLLTASTSFAQAPATLGVGVMGGDPTGFNLKLWYDDILAFDGGVGLRDDTVFYGGIMMHSWNALMQPQEGRLGLYGGVGPRFVMSEDDTGIGVRTFAGVTFLALPFELYAEGGPVFDFEPDSEVDVDLNVGVRFYFGEGF